MNIANLKHEVSDTETVTQNEAAYNEQKNLKKFSTDNATNSEKLSNMKIFTLQHKRTKRIVEVNALTAVLAAKLVGWRNRHVVILEEKGKSNI